MAGVAGVAMTEALPLSPSQTVVTVVPEGYQFPKGREKTIEFGAAVDAGYFSTLNVEIKRGRAFTDDDRAGSRRVAIVNQQFAKTYWPGQDPIGKRIRLDSADGPAAEVVGVAKTGHYLAVNEAPAPYVYVPYEQNPRSRMTLVVQSVGDAGELAKPLREAVRSIDGNVPVFNLRTVATLYESRVTDTWLQFFQMVGTMGFIGLALATTGLYGLVAYTVSRRVKEFGIRVAVGASRRDVVWLVERRGLILAGVGIAIGGVLTRGGSATARGGLSRTRRIFPGGVRSCSAGVVDGQRGCKLCAGTARRGAGSAAGPAERIGAAARPAAAAIAPRPDPGLSQRPRLHPAAGAALRRG